LGSALVEPGHGLRLIRQVADQASLYSDPSGTVVALSFHPGPPGQLTPFRVAQRFEHGCAIVAVTGQLDLGSAGKFAAVAGDLITATPGLVLDLSGLTLWDSSGLTALITAQRRISRDPAARMIPGRPARPPRPAPARGRRC
jgi:ABC-type transporter Mla MlaB component